LTKTQEIKVEALSKTEIMRWIILWCTVSQRESETIVRHIVEKALVLGQCDDKCSFVESDSSGRAEAHHAVIRLAL
jgi:hypothetical protein